MNLINPYNFVPLGSGPKRSTPPQWERLHDKNYSGVLVCELSPLRPLISLDHEEQRRNNKTHTLVDEKGNRLKNKKGKEYEPIKVFRFLRNSQNQPILQGTTLKGLIRSIYETLTDSCLTLELTTGSAKKGNQEIPYNYQDPGTYKNIECNRLDNLCPACRLFGTIEGDNVHYQGRLVFSDAVLTAGKLSDGRRIFLKELSHPKPFHRATYGKSTSAGGPIAGRKFYYHHSSSPEYQVEQHKSNDRSFAVDEMAGLGCKFRFTITLTNLTEGELGNLLLALELDRNGNGELAHKLGVGKALGLGSCRIRVDQHASRVYGAAARYAGWEEPGATGWYALKSPDTAISLHLREVLRLNKYTEGTIAYPGFKSYPKDPIDDTGVFGGNYKIPHSRLSTPKATLETTAVSPPESPPPRVGPDQIAAWLKSVDLQQDRLIFVDVNGEEHHRPASSFQGKKNTLEPRHWFILWGEKASRRAP